MSELISKTEVIDDLKKDIEESDNWLIISIYLAITVRIMSYKNIDAVEVIPCKNCFYAKPYNKTWRLPINENCLWCEHHNEEKELNWFCADAIRRTE